MRPLQGGNLCRVFRGSCIIILHPPPRHALTPPPERSMRAKTLPSPQSIHPTPPPPVLPLSPVNLPLTCSVAHEDARA